MKVLILQAGFNELGVIDALKKMGHQVIAIGNQRGLIGQQYVDEYHCLDYTRMEEVYQFALEQRIDRVCACCNDSAALTAAYVAERMGLKGYDTYENMLIMCHKDRFKQFAMQHDILTLPSKSFSQKDSAFDYLESDTEYPIIVKPVDLSGGKGISKANSQPEALQAVENAFAISRSKEIVIERFIEGTQHGFCAFLHNQKVTAYSSNNEYSVVNPYRVEIDTFPAENIALYKDILIEQIEKIADILHLADGIFHLQYMVSQGKIYILEVMRRIIGNMYSVPAMGSSGFDWDYWQARAGIGESCDNINATKCTEKYYAYRVIIPKKNGTVKDIIIEETLDPYIYSKYIFGSIGQKLDNYKSETIGILFFRFHSQTEMMHIMKDLYDKVYVEMDD